MAGAATAAVPEDRVSGPAHAAPSSARSAVEPAREDAAQVAFARAQTLARADDVAAAKAALREALELGFGDFAQLQWSGDLAPLRADPEWPALMAIYDRDRAWAAMLRPLLEMRRPGWPTYARVRGQVAEFDGPQMYADLFRQYYATHAFFAGDYAETHRYYPVRTRGGAEAVAAGYTTAVPATGAILARSRGRQAVFLNEAHGTATTRAVLFELVRALRREGFDHLALETLTASDTGGCARNTPEDAGLQARGHATVISGAYLRDPVYAELVRVAIAEGYTLVSYDPINSANQSQRVQAQASNLGCLFRRDPSARLVVIAGFGNLAENAGAPPDQQLGGVHFTRLTGIDPLSVDLTRLLDLDESKVARIGDGVRWLGPWLLLDAKGRELHLGPADVSVFVPIATDRDQGGWLTLGGYRQPVVVDRDGCPGPACLLQARRPGEADDAIAADRCVVAGDASSCRLYLPPGDFLIERLEGDGQVHSRGTIHVPSVLSGP